jgi:ATP synthase F1 delta subunit
VKPVKEAKKYAKTLINVVGIDEVPRALAELGVIEETMARSREFRNLLVNPAFSKEEKDKVLKLLAEKIKLSEKSLKFVIHLSDNMAVTALPEIIRIATSIYREKKKRAKAVVMTPVEITDGFAARIKASLEKLIKRDVDLEYVLDPSLLGGVLVKVGSTMYDSSIKGQLRLLKDELVKG